MDSHQQSMPAFAPIETPPGACRRGVHGVKRHGEKLRKQTQCVLCLQYSTRKTNPKQTQSNPIFSAANAGASWQTVSDLACISPRGLTTTRIYAVPVGAGLCARPCPLSRDCRERFAASNPLIDYAGGRRGPPLRQDAGSFSTRKQYPGRLFET